MEKSTFPFFPLNFFGSITNQELGLPDGIDQMPVDWGYVAFPPLTGHLAPSYGIHQTSTLTTGNSPFKFTIIVSPFYGSVEMFKKCVFVSGIANMDIPGP
jgi:hypothetical protein